MPPRQIDYSEPLGIALEGWRYPFAGEISAAASRGRGSAHGLHGCRSAGAGQWSHHCSAARQELYGEYWANTIRVLTSAGYRVVVPDQIGFGKSSKPDIAYSFKLLAEHTDQLLDCVERFPEP
jgi:hypothetical protein